jgi:hypothetical protein
MRFLCIYKPAPKEGAPPTPEMMETMGKFIGQAFKEGYLLSTEGCLPSPSGHASATPAATAPSPTAPTPSPKRPSAASP